MKAHRSSEVTGCTEVEINRKGTTGISSYSKVYTNNLKYKLGTLAVYRDQMQRFLAVLGPEIKFYRYVQVPRCTENNRKVTRDVEFTNRVDPNCINCIIWTLSRRFQPNILILAVCGPEMKIHRSSMLPGFAEINKEGTTGI